MTPEMILLIVLLILYAVSAALLWGFLSRSRRREQALEDRLRSLLDERGAEQADTLSALRRELAADTAAQVKNLGDLLALNQQTAAAAQASSLQSAERQTAASLSALSETVQRTMAVQGERIGALEESVRKSLSEMRGQLNESMRLMQQSNDKRLSEIRQSVDERLQSTLEKKMNESFRQVSSQLEQVYRGLGEMQTLAGSVGDLKKVLSNVKTRGILGEIQLGAILGEILAPEQYLTDVATVPGSGNRVEFAIRMPGEDGRQVLLPIDSKFPGDCYAQLQDAYDSGDPERVKAAGAVLESRIKSFAKDIHDKYIAPPDTTAFGVMFLPSEGLYAEVVNRGLVETLQREYQVNVAGPSTMAALLNALQMGFKTIAIQKRSQEVWQLLGAVRTEFDRFTEVLASTQKRLQLAGDDLDKLIGVRTRAINRRLREVERMDPDTARELLDE